MRREINVYFVLQLVLGAALIVFGIMAINGYNSAGQEAVRGLNKMFGKSNNIFPITFGIVQLVAGIVLALALFVPIDDGIYRIVHIVICVFFLISIVLNFFLSNFIEPDLVRWLGALLPQVVILLAIWIVGYQD
ncbi:MAG: hypothetical protein PQJ50_13300 [Spirochaetales bacterium]|nr:hypothetical protein [Spirochaetales bacterium]